MHAKAKQQRALRNFSLFRSNRHAQLISSSNLGVSRYTLGCSTLGLRMPRTQDRFVELLQSDDFAGHIIRWVAIFETRLDELLAAYFSNRRHDVEFYELILSRLSFAAKIEILRSIALTRPLKSKQNIVASLDRLRRLRNALAHTSHMSDRDIQKLRSDAWIVAFVVGYPKTVSREKNALENRITLLWKYLDASKVITET